MAPRRVRIRLKAAGIAAGALLVAVTIAVTFMALSVNVAPEPASDKAASYLATPPVQVEPSIFVAIGDSYTGGSNAGGSSGTPSNWVVSAANTLRKKGHSLIEIERGIGGSGYVSRGPNGKVFGELIPENLNDKTDVVVFFGSINDQAQPLDQIRAAADKAFAEAKSAAPNAKFIIVGPAWMTAEVPADIVAINEVVKELAEKNQFEFLDPTAERWFQDRLDLIGKDSVHPTDAGHLFMAEKIAPHVEAALPAL